MMKDRLFIALLVMVWLFMMVGSPVSAQEVTPEPDVPVVVVEDEPVSEVSVNVVQVIIGLLSAFAAGGIVGIAGLAIFVDRLRNDATTVTALEKLAESYPPGTRDLLMHISRTVESIGELGKEVFDGVPIVEKETVNANALSEASH